MALVRGGSRARMGAGGWSVNMKRGVALGTAIPAIAGVTLSFGLTSSFTVLYPVVVRP